MHCRLLNNVVALQLILIFCLFVLPVHLVQYEPPGEVFPEEVEIEIGDSVNISCRMNLARFRKQNSSNLYFFDSETQEVVPSKYLAIWNESTTVFMLRNAEEQQKNYICKIGTDAIMQTKVYVGTRPKPVSDFSCRSYDFEFMVCNFTQPHNTILTPYNLTFHTQSEDYRFLIPCNTDDKPLIVCNTTAQSQIYKPKEEHYHFRLTGSNPLETREFSYEFNNWNNMIPARPGVDFRVIELSTDTLQVAWKMPKYDFYKRRGESTLQWEIILKPNDFPAQNLSDDVQVVFSRNELRLKLTALKYVYYWYKLRLRVRVRYAPLNDDSWWSEAFVYDFRTSASEPDVAPRTDVGSFYVDVSQLTQVRLYWEQLPAYKKNGANFSYIISDIKQNGKSINLQPIQLELNSAKFPLQKNLPYEYTIRSRNHMGESLDESRIKIFSMTNNNLKTQIPSRIHNVYHATNRTYTLTWLPPIVTTKLQDYTVFWCYAKRAQLNECEGSIHFKHVPKDTTKFTTDPQSEEHSLNLAVSANYPDFNAGMHWTECSMIHNTDLIKMDPVIQPISNHSIRIQWTSGSICPSILDGYNITYCEVGNNIPIEQASCVGKPIVIPIKDTNAKTHTLDNLKPYTFYKIDMFMYSRMKVGKPSDPIFIQTKEAAPTEPRHLEHSKIANSSVTISWLPPSQPNGNIRHYIVNLNNEQRIVKPNDDDRDPGAKIVYELRNLSSYTAYKVYVTAVTVNSSPTSNDIHFTTLIGYPSLPGSAVPIRDTSNNTIIQWSKPTISAGRIDFYEVAVTVMRNDEIIRKRISIVMGATSCAVKIPICIDHEYKTILAVRAVNAADKSFEVAANDLYDSVLMDPDEMPEYYEDNEDLNCIGGEINATRIQLYRNRSHYKLFKSPWQHGPTYGCSANRLSKITIIALMIVVFGLGLMTALYFARKKYNKMANIDCTLPPGLESYPTKIGIDNETLDKHELEHHRSKEIIFHNEKHHLLASSVCNDSGYLGADGRTLTNNDSGVNKMLDYMRTTSESSTDSMVESIADSIENHIVKNTEQLNMQNIQKSGTIERCNENQSMHILPVSNGYIKQNKIMNWQATEELPTTSHCGAGGYVSLGSIGLTPINANGYVQPQLIQKSFPPLKSIAENVDSSVACLNNGYTTLDELDKQRSLNAPPQQENVQAIGGAGNGNAAAAPSLISGYVTQRDLTAFGEQHFT